MWFYAENGNENLPFRDRPPFTGKMRYCMKHVQIFTQSPFTTIERTMKEFLKPPCEKELSFEEIKRYSRRVV